MRTYIFISLLFLTLIPFSLVAQTPQKIHDLKSLTDSDGTVHLFYRIYAEYEGTEYFTDNIYHYNTDTGEENLFLEHFYDTRYGFPFNNRILDFKFLENNLENYVYIINADMHTYISRSDSTELIGGHLVTFDHLNAEGTDSGMVYVEMLGEVIIGKNGGRNWPDADAENFEEIPDSSKLNFPLTSLSPYNDSLMFGRRSFQRDGENAFLRSLDKGKTSEFISDTLLSANVSFDIDSKTVYIIDVLSTPVPEVNCEINTCNYGLFINENRGSTEDWELKQIFPSRVNTPSFPKILTHPTQSGKLYVWNADSVLMTEDYGGNFEVLTNPPQELTGFTATPFGEYYTTNSTLYKKEGEISVELFSIPVSNEAEVESPEQFELLQNYPNPFNPVTTITYRMRTAGLVSIELYTIQGQRVRELVNDFKTEGQHSIRLNGSDLASGIYILRGKMGIQTETRKITLIK